MRFFKKKSNFSDEHKTYLALLDTSNRMFEADKEFLYTLNKKDKELALLNLDTDEIFYKLERLILCLSALPLHLKKINLNKNVIDYCFTQILVDFNIDSVNNKLSKIDIKLEDYVTERYKLYFEEIKLLLSIDNPHPGRILWYQYHPFSKIIDTQIPKSKEGMENNLPIGFIISVQAYIYFFNTTQRLITKLLPESINICIKEL